MRSSGEEGELSGELRVRVAIELEKQGQKEAAAQALDRVVLDEGMTAGAVREGLIPEAKSQIEAGLRAAQKS